MTIHLQHSTDGEIVRAARVLGTIDAAASHAGVDYLVIGATARNIISAGLAGAPPERQTRDVDIAAKVASWEQFEKLAAKLDQRLTVHKFRVDGSEVDVVPYGDIEQPGRTILWPDDHELNVLGLREAVDSAEVAVLPGDVTVKVPSVPALALLKILAWWDRSPTETRDAIDLATMIGWYSEGTYFELLYTDELATLERFEHNPALAGAYLLGSHMRLLLDEESDATLVRIADDGDLQGKLARDMVTALAGAKVAALCSGIRDAAAGKHGRG